MLRLLLAAALLALVALMLLGRIGEWRRLRTARAPAVVASLPGEPAPSTAGGSLPSGLDSLARLSARIQLAGGAGRHYLDSLVAVTDSVIRHWPVGDAPIWYALVPGGAPEFRDEMALDARAGLDAWSPLALGLRPIETADTAQAVLVVTWVTSLRDRAGVTNVTWDRSGRILRARVTLATRDPASGELLAPDARRAIALHEMGHALGLPHSALAEDAMHPVTVATAPTARDLASIRLLYSLPLGWIGAGGRPPAWP